MKNFRIPINLKIIALVTVLIAGPISFLTYQSIDLQKQSLLSSAYDKNSLEVKLMQERLISIIKNGNNSLKTILMNDNSPFEEFKIHAETVSKNQQEIKNTFIWKISLENSSSPQLWINIKNEANDSLQNIQELVSDSVVEALPDLLKNGYSVSGINLGNEQYLVILVSDILENKEIVVASGVVPLNKFSSQSNMIVLYNREIIYQSDLTWEEIDKNPLVIKAEKDSLNNSSGEYNWKGVKYLGAYSKNSSLLVAIFQPLDRILFSLYDLIQKIVVASMLVFSTGIALAVSASRKIFGNPIEDLMAITKKIGTGNFKVQIKEKPNDELGDLGVGFEQMSKKIVTLMQDQEQKIKLENEVNLAATVHKTILPATDFENEYVKIKNVSIAASYLGGDIFDYYAYENKMVLMIADATGHGINSALATTAVKGAISSSVEFQLRQPNAELSVEDILQRANLAVFNTSKGQVMMTMFLAIVDFEKKTINYSNAGHNPPWLFKASGKVESFSSPGRRLGESSKLEGVKSQTATFSETDVFFLYTDGLIETTNLKNEMFDKKQVRKILQETLFTKGFESAFKQLLTTFNSFIKGKAYPDDDVGVLMVQFKEKKEVLEKEAS